MAAETILKKLKTLDQQKEQALAQLNAILGAQQVCRDLLDEVRKEDADHERSDAVGDRAQTVGV